MALLYSASCRCWVVRDAAAAAGAAFTEGFRRSRRRPSTPPCRHHQHEWRRTGRITMSYFTQMAGSPPQLSVGGGRHLCPIGSSAEIAQGEGHVVNYGGHGRASLWICCRSHRGALFLVSQGVVQNLSRTTKGGARSATVTTTVRRQDVARRAQNRRFSRGAGRVAGDYQAFGTTGRFFTAKAPTR